MYQKFKYAKLRNQTIGEINYTNKEYITKRSFAEHFFNKFNGFGLSFRTLDHIQAEGVETVIIILTDKGGQTLTAPVSSFICNGLEYTDNSKGFEDKQLILPMQYFNRKISLEQQSKL